MQVSLGVAVRNGWMMKDAVGNYSEVTGVTTEAPDEQQQEPNADADDAPVPFAPEAEAMAEQIAAQVPPTLQTAAIEQIINGGLEALDVSAAMTSGMDPNDYREGITGIALQFQAQAFDSLRKQGVDPAHFRQWVQQHDPEGIRAAARQHVASRNPKAYAPLVKAYLTANAPTTGALKRGGYQTRTENGIEMVNIGGMWTSVAAATRAGMI